MAICDKIKEHRAKNQLTQHQLAERVGVTPQAISKWEKGTGYPDVSLIVSLANALRISTDELLEHKNTLKELNIKWLHLFAKCDKRLAPWEELVKLDNEILQEFPHDETSLYRRVRDELYAARNAKKIEDKKKWLSRAESHCAGLVDEYPDFDSAKTTFVKILMESDRKDLAIYWAHRCKNPDQAMKGVLRGDELRRHRQRIIDNKLRDLLIEMRYKDLDSLQTSENIIRAFFSDENFQYYYDFLMMIEYTRARYFAVQSDCDNAVSYLYKALEIAKEKLIKGKGKFTVPIFDSLPPEGEDCTLVEQLYDMLETVHPDFETVFESKQYQDLLKDIKALI